MKRLLFCIGRNTKLFFKDKGVCLSAMIAPLILLFLFVAFLGDVYRDSLLGCFPQGIELDSRLVEGFAGGWLMSSLLAVSAVTIAFTANLIMVQDRVTGRIDDLEVSPVPQATLALAYYLSTALVTLLVCGLAYGAGLIYLAAVGWYMSVADVFLSLLDVVLLVLFGTALSSIVCHFLHSQGAITAVEAIVSAAYGFLCGAYMPIAQLAEGLQSVLKFLPGTYGTVLLHEHFMGGAIDAMQFDTVPEDVTGGISEEMLSGVRSGFDCTIEVFGNSVPEWAMYLILILTIVLLLGIYVGLCVLRGRKRKGNRR